VLVVGQSRYRALPGAGNGQQAVQVADRAAVTIRGLIGLRIAQRGKVGGMVPGCPAAPGVINS